MLRKFAALAFHAVAGLVLVSTAPGLRAQTYTESVIHNFCAQTNCADGSTSQAVLVQAADGNFYGTTDDGGAYNRGTIFKISPSGTYATLHSFCANYNSTTGNCVDGGTPNAGLIQGSDGNFYGTTYYGGANGSYGTVYRMTPAGAYSTIYNFCNDLVDNVVCADGQFPYGGLVQGADGRLYGTTIYGGAGSGLVFSLNLSGGSFSVVYAFCTALSCTDGAGPYAGLVQGTDGNFYGSTEDTGGGNPNSVGTVYQLTPSGGHTVIYNFCEGPSSGSDCAEGSVPRSTLVIGADGELYGIATESGAYGFGSVFKVSTGGALTPLHSFCSGGQGNCTDGALPIGGLVLATDGNFYGTTDEGDYGKVFSITSAGSLTTLHSFCSSANCEDGEYPAAAFVQGADGILYSTTTGGGINSAGTVFTMTASPRLSAPVQLSPASATILPGGSATLTFSVLNAFSMTLQQCYGFQTVNGVMVPLGLLHGTLSGGIFQGSATFTVPKAGNYQYAVTCGGMESAYATLIVTEPETLGVVASPNPGSVGQPVTLTATVAVPQGNAVPTGKMTFLYGAQVLATSTMSSGMASFRAPTNGLPSGNYSVTASYSGDSNYAPVTTAPYNVILNKAPTATVLQASPTSVMPPAAVMLTATVMRSATGAAGVPAGSVTFYSGSQTLGKATLNGSGVATYSAATGGVPPASYPVNAKYAGDAFDNNSGSNTVTVKVQ